MSALDAAVTALGLAQCQVIVAERELKRRDERYLSEVELVKAQGGATPRGEEALRQRWLDQRDARRTLNEQTAIRDSWLNAVAMHVADWTHDASQCPLCAVMREAVGR